MDYKQDGTYVGQWTLPGYPVIYSAYPSIVVTDFTSTQLDTIAVEAFSSGSYVSLNDINNQYNYLVLAFPEPRNLSGIYFNNGLTSAGSSFPALIEASANSTNGVDGTWDAVGTITRSSDYTGGTTNDAYRTNIFSLSLSNITSLRVRTQGSNVATRLHQLHVYGTSALSAGRLRLWHPTLNQEVPGSYLDWGDTPRGSSGDKQFRIKNTSTSLTASNVTLQFYEPGSVASPSSVYQHFVSDDGLAFRGLIRVPSIGPGQLAGPFYVRRVTPTDAVTTMPVVVKIALEGTWV